MTNKKIFFICLRLHVIANASCSPPPEIVLFGIRRWLVAFLRVGSWHVRDRENADRSSMYTDLQYMDAQCRLPKLHLCQSKICQIGNRFFRERKIILKNNSDFLVICSRIKLSSKSTSMHH